MRRAIHSFRFALLAVLVTIGCDSGATTDATNENAPAPSPSDAAPAEQSDSLTPATARSGASDTVTTGARGVSPAEVESRVLTPGSGASPSPGAIVRIHCRGWTLGPDGRGSKFVDTYAAGVAERYVLTDDIISRSHRSVLPDAPRPLIPGLVEAIARMKTGERREVRVPARLGYGDQGNRPLVPPGSDLVFEVELVGVEPAR